VRACVRACVRDDERGKQSNKAGQAGRQVGRSEKCLTRPTPRKTSKQDLVLRFGTTYANVNQRVHCCLCASTTKEFPATSAGQDMEGEKKSGAPQTNASDRERHRLQLGALLEARLSGADGPGAKNPELYFRLTEEVQPHVLLGGSWTTMYIFSYRADLAWLLSGGAAGQTATATATATTASGTSRRIWLITDSRNSSTGTTTITTSSSSSTSLSGCATSTIEIDMRKSEEEDEPQQAGHFHLKLIFCCYLAGLRMIVSTANFEEGNWRQDNGVWWQDFPVLPSSSSCRSNDFQRDLQRFLQRLEDFVRERGRGAPTPPAGSSSSSEELRLSELATRYNFSAASVALVSTFPWKEEGQELGVGRVRSLLLASKEKEISAPSTLVMRASSRTNDDQLGNFLPALVFSTFHLPRLKEQNVIIASRWSGAEKMEEIASTLTSQMEVKVSVTRYKGHIKFYARYYSSVHQEEEQGYAWCLLTSQNLSFSAWGCWGAGPNLELGIMFLPERFSAISSSSSTTQSKEQELLKFSCAPGSPLDVFPLRRHQKESSNFLPFEYLPLTREEIGATPT
jgi:hypothetical protein